MISKLFARMFSFDCNFFHHSNVALETMCDVLLCQQRALGTGSFALNHSAFDPNKLAPNNNVPSERASSNILNRLSKTMHTAASLRKKRKDSLPPLACTQQAYGEKESFAWTGNFLKMPHISKKNRISLS